MKNKKYNDCIYVDLSHSMTIRNEGDINEVIKKLSSLYSLKLGERIGSRLTIHCVRMESQGLVNELNKLGIKTCYLPFTSNMFKKAELEGKADIAKEIAQNLSSSLSKLIMSIITTCAIEPYQVRVNQDKKMIIGRDFSNKCESEIAYVTIIKGNLCIIDTTDKIYPMDVLTINDKFEIINALLKLLG